MLGSRCSCRRWIVVALVATCLLFSFQSDGATRRILLVGDSWPMFMWRGDFGGFTFWTGRAFQETLIEKGLGQWEEYGDWTAIGTSMAWEWGQNLPAVHPSGAIGRIDLVCRALRENPTIDIVHLSLGGNDYGRGDYSPFLSYREYQMQSLTLNGDPDGGTFTLTFNGQTTGPIAFDADAADVQAALEALSTIGAGNIVVTETSEGADYFFQFQGVFADQDVPMMSANGSGLTGDGNESVTMNDVRFDDGWQKKWGKDSPAETLFFDAVMDQIRTVILAMLDVRPDIRVALCDYDYMNDERGDATVAETNIAGMRMGLHKLGLMEEISAMPEYKDRAWYINPGGLMQYVYGYPNPGTDDLPKWAIYGPNGTPGTQTGLTIDPPHGYPDYALGGDINYPSPMITILPGVGGSDIHLNKAGYWTLARYCIDEFYAEWLNYPKVLSITRTSMNPILPDHVYSPTGLSQVAFDVTFSEPVEGVDESDFLPLMSGGLAGATIDSVVEAKDPVTYTVIVNTGDGAGSLGLAVADNDSIVDNEGYELGGPGNGNGYSAIGEAYSIDPMVNLPVAAWPAAIVLAAFGAVLTRKYRQ